MKEYASNPFIARLRAPEDLPTTINRLYRPIIISAAERDLPPHLRRHCVLRIKDWFLPAAQHTVVDERVDMLIRRGYLARNPADGTFARRLSSVADAIEAGVAFNDVVPTAQSTADGFALLGTPGMGKTRLMGRILRSYDQVIEHRGDLNLKQVVWLEAECPTNGSLGQLCKNILAALDQALGRRKYARVGRLNVEDMLLHVAQALQLHAVGVLAIDEINFLNAARTDKDRVVNFLTSLVNVFSVPVLFVGTFAGEGVMTGNLRNARRGSGLGSMVFEPYDLDGAWRTFSRKLFRYQWLSVPTPWDEDLSKALWQESRGILDVAVKMFMLAQLRLIRSYEVDGSEEVITSALFSNISITDLRLVQPMLDALREGSIEALIRYGDLRPVTRLASSSMAAYGLDSRMAKIETILDAAEPAPEQAFGDALGALGMAGVDAAALINELRNRSAAPAPREVDRLGELQADDDARRIVKDGRAHGLSGYEALKAAGMVGEGE